MPRRVVASCTVACIGAEPVEHEERESARTATASHQSEVEREAVAGDPRLPAVTDDVARIEGGATAPYAERADAGDDERGPERARPG
jgi:hypothetical protein